MIVTRPIVVPLLGATVLCCLLGGCDDDTATPMNSGEGLPETSADVGSDADADTDADTDTDTDTDADMDMDTDVDADDDSEGDAVFSASVSIMPNTDGWIDGDDNPLGIQGAWYSFASWGSTIVPAQGEPFINDGVDLCTTGEAAMVLNNDWSLYYGAAIGFDLCATGADDVSGEAKFSLGACPLNRELASRFKGISFVLSGRWGTAPLRVTFKETGRAESAYVEVTAPGALTARPENAAVWYDPEADGVNIANIESVHFQVPTTTTGTTRFDFCISEIAVLTK